MKKFTFLLVLIGLSIWSFSQINQRITPKRPAGKKLQQVSESRAAYEVFWEEDFTNVANGGDADEGWTYMDTDDHGFVYIDADTIYSGVSMLGGEANPGVNMIEGGSANGYLHFPIQHYNCVPDTWPRVLVEQPLEMDAAIESPWISLAGAPDNTCLQFSTLWILCCSPAASKIDVNITTDGENWTTFNGREIDGIEVPFSNWGRGKWRKNITEYLEGAEQLKIQIHVYGVQAYFFSVDDIKLVELPLNDLSLVECFSSTELASLVEQSGFHSFWNLNYSEVPANIKTTVYMGAKVKQEGLEGENVNVEFKIEGADGMYWPDNAPALAYNPIPNMALYQESLLMVSDQASFDHPVFYNPELSISDFPTEAVMEAGIPYTFHYKVVSDNVDDITTNNEYTYDFAQTLGRFSYHWQPSISEQVSIEKEIGPFSFNDPTGVEGDILGNIFGFYQEEGETFKIYGVRVFIPNSENVTFDASGNGVSIRPVLYRYNALGDNGAGAYEELTLVLGEEHLLNESEEGSYIMLTFNEESVNTFDFEQGQYVVGFVVDDYNDQKFAVGVDDSFRQGGLHSVMKIEPWADEWKYPYPKGSVMIDAYTNMDEIQNFYLLNDMPQSVSALGKDQIEIYPNPSTGIINIKNAEQSTIYVYTITGDLVRVIESEWVELTVNLADLSNGSYLLKIVKEKEVVTKKITLNK